MVEKKFDPNMKFTITNIVNAILEYTRKWTFTDKIACPWYRGQPGEYPPLPSVFRKDYDEFNLNTTFRNRATALKSVPETNRLDKWLFLMQHYGAPTRLLDWTESLLNALFFALDTFYYKCNCEKKDKNPSIWAINPYQLNKFSYVDGFPNTWSRYDKMENGKVINTNTGVEHFRLAFHPKSQWSETINKKIVKYPIAVNSNYLDMRILSQRSCFTIHGTAEEDFVSIFKDTKLEKQNYFLKFIIPQKHTKKLLKELNDLGINKSSVYPDLEHLAQELKQRFDNND